MKEFLFKKTSKQTNKNKQTNNKKTPQKTKVIKSNGKTMPSPVRIQVRIDLPHPLV
jgi:hypothetical protein